jgi:hypothetical protein
MSPTTNSNSNVSNTEQQIEQDIIGGFGFALGGVLASVILLWFGGKQIKKALKEAT